MDTIWRDIAGYEGHYQVSNTGEVRSVKNGPFLLKGDHQRNGYKRVYLWLNGGKKNFCVHRLVAEAFIPNPFHLTDVNHLDEDKDNNAVWNLEWCTHLYNMNYGNVRRKISLANIGRTISEEHRKKLSRDTSRRRWINDGETEKYVYKETVETYVAAGWLPGRLKRERSNDYVRESEPIAC